MIEADVELGKVKDGDGTIIPIMAHPPTTESDLSLQQFLQRIITHNTDYPCNSKGVKLDFKSIESFDESLPLLISLWPKVLIIDLYDNNIERLRSSKLCRNQIETCFRFCSVLFLAHICLSTTTLFNVSQMRFPVWVNADILPGPVNNVDTTPVDADRFLQACNTLSDPIISVGWTTLWDGDHRVGQYTEEHANELFDAINRNVMDHAITIPVRAGIAAQSPYILSELLDKIDRREYASTRPTTLTIWSHLSDYVNVNQLRELIEHIGRHRTYLDVTAEVMTRFGLGNRP